MSVKPRRPRYLLPLLGEDLHSRQVFTAKEFCENWDICIWIWRFYTLFSVMKIWKSQLYLFSGLIRQKNVTLSIVSFVLYGDINYVPVEEIAYHYMANIFHYSDVMMGAMAPEIMSITIVYSTIYSGADQGKYEWSASLAFVRGFYWWPLNSPHKWPVTRKMFPFDDVIIYRMDPPTPTPSLTKQMIQ